MALWVNPTAFFFLVVDFGFGPTGARVYVDADHALVRIFGVLETIITEFQGGLIFAARAKGTMTLNTGGDGRQFRFYFNMSQDGRHFDTPDLYGHADFHVTGVLIHRRERAYRTSPGASWGIWRNAPQERAPI